MALPLLMILFLLIMLLFLLPAFGSVHMTEVGCRTPPISQLTVRALPFITNRALLAGVTMYCPNSPEKKSL